jgi:hypothetical protein
MGAADRCGTSAPGSGAVAGGRVVRAEGQAARGCVALPADCPAPQAGPDTEPPPDYDPAVHSLAARERAGAAWLAGLSIEGASVRTPRRKRKRYREQRLAGLVDRRGGPLLERAERPLTIEDP